MPLGIAKSSLVRSAAANHEAAALGKVSNRQVVIMKMPSLNRVMTVAASAFLVGACATTEYVDKQIAASEQRQAAIDSAQNEQISQLSGSLAEALQRVNQSLALRQPGTKMTSATSSLIVSFDRGAVKLADADKAKLTELAVALLSTGAEFFLEVQGHTDSTGSARANAEIGAKRADAVRLFLHEKGVPLRRMSSISFGDTMPLMTGSDPAEQAGNRRVEIIVLK